MRMLLAMILAAAAALISGPKLIAWLRKLKFGQTIYELGPQTHKQKQGTPTMGGLMIALGLLLGAVICAPANSLWGLGWQNYIWPLLFVTFGSMGVGFADDYIKVVKKRSLGLTPWQKIFGQVFVAVAFALYCYLHPMVGSSVVVPFVNVQWDLGIFYIPLTALTVLFMVNSANLQDGLDGLLSSVTGVGSLAWALVAVFMMQLAADAGAQDNLMILAVFALALTGGCIGFLRFNHYPATVFMGDTGSMLIGGATVGMAFLLRQPFLLLLIAFTMVMSSVSVILQRYYYKGTRKLFGEPRRLFKMAPIHHHFELCGMKETQIVLMYTVLTVVLSAIALLSLNGLQLR